MRGTTRQCLQSALPCGISIHVPRAGYDRFLLFWCLFHLHFYPRTPCGVRLLACVLGFASIAFLSTYPVRGTTVNPVIAVHVLNVFLSTYPVRGTTRQGEQYHNDYTISIHVPRAGYDATLIVPPVMSFIFLSTYPVRGTTRVDI